MQPTLANIARIAEVNPSTVSRIVNGSPEFAVSPATRDRVLRIARQLNYQPKRAARALVSGKSFTAAVVLGRLERDLSSPTFTQTLGALTRELWRHGYALTMLPIDPERGIDEEVLRTVRGSHADGYFVPFTMLKPRTLAELRRAGTPVVSIRRTNHPQDERAVDEADSDGIVSYARLDEQPAAKQVIAELVRLGHRKVVCFGYRPQCEERFRLYREAAATYPRGTIELSDCSYERRETGWIHDRATAQREARDRFEVVMRSTAVLCVSDQIANGLMDVLVERGVEPGRDLSVIGQDNLEENPSSMAEQPRLATVDRNNDGLGRAVAKLLLERMTGMSVEPRSMTVPTRLIRRQTLGPARAS